MATRNEKIKLLKNVATGATSLQDFKKEMAVIDGRVQVLVGKDAEDYSLGKIDKKDLVFIAGKPAKVLKEKQINPIEENYV